MSHREGIIDALIVNHGVYDGGFAVDAAGQRRNAPFVEIPHISGPNRSVTSYGAEIRFENNTPRFRVLNKVMPWLRFNCAPRRDDDTACDMHRAPLMQ
ncbi:hypothetical protein FHS72_001168 [Loktanella ponticola]|uniref:Uncharacterized protein n=1 Tax=Yoonia ponticola TaxID=1524255 RepID=A0A7W9EZ41_9RHOB|nr:hypothetical protein [Yoonia ponticola]